MTVLYSFPQRASDAISSTDCCTSENISLRILATCYGMIHHVSEFRILRRCSGGLMQWNIAEGWTFVSYQVWKAVRLCWAMSTLITCFTGQFPTLHLRNVFSSQTFIFAISSRKRIKHSASYFVLTQTSQCRKRFKPLILPQTWTRFEFRFC